MRRRGGLAVLYLLYRPRGLSLNTKSFGHRVAAVEDAHPREIQQIVRTIRSVAEPASRQDVITTNLNCRKFPQCPRNRSRDCPRSRVPATSAIDRARIVERRSRLVDDRA